MPQKEHTFTKFDDDLNLIGAHVLEMCELVEMQFKQSLKAFFKSDAIIARQVIDQDYVVNQLEVKIDSLCVIAIARQQPIASDLQSIIIATKTVVNLERIGDEAKKIARIAERLAQKKHMPMQRFTRILAASELARQELTAVIHSFIHLDIPVANELLNSEDSSEEEFNTIFRELIQSMTDDPRTISSSLEILFVAKAIERIENQIKLIAKLVIDASNRYGEI